MSPDEILTREELAARLQVSPETVSGMDLPSFPAGKRRRRYIWGQVVEELRARADAVLERIR